MDVLKKDLKVMDATAISLCKDNNMPIPKRIALYKRTRKKQ